MIAQHPVRPRRRVQSDSRALAAGAIRVGPQVRAELRAGQIYWCGQSAPSEIITTLARAGRGNLRTRQQGRGLTAHRSAISRTVQPRCGHHPVPPARPTWPQGRPRRAYQPCWNADHSDYQGSVEPSRSASSSQAVESSISQGAVTSRARVSMMRRRPSSAWRRASSSARSASRSRRASTSSS